MLQPKNRTMLVYCKLEKSLACIGMFLLVWGCTNDAGDEGPKGTENPVDAYSATRVNYLALGDSYTIGTGLPNPNDAFPFQLAERLNTETNLEVSAPLIIAQNGWTTANLQAGIAAATIDSVYQLVSLLIGVNNQFQGRPLDEYAAEFTALLEQAIGFAGGDTTALFVLSIPDYGVTPFGQNMNPQNIAAEIDTFNQVNESIAGEYGVSYYNITTISRGMAQSAGALAPDNLHPSAIHYGAWVESFYEQIKSKIDE